MKNKYIPLLLIGIICTYFFNSCTQEYTCQCTVTYSGAAGMPDSSIKEYKVRDTRKKAISICEANSKNYDEKEGVTAKEVCKLF